MCDKINNESQFKFNFEFNGDWKVNYVSYNIQVL